MTDDGMRDLPPCPVCGEVLREHIDKLVPPQSVGGEDWIARGLASFYPRMKELMRDHVREKHDSQLPWFNREWPDEVTILVVTKDGMRMYRSG